jgi:hypothetical protein
MKICWFQQIAVVAHKSILQLGEEAPDLMAIAEHVSQIKLLCTMLEDKLKDEGVILDNEDIRE